MSTWNFYYVRCANRHVMMGLLWNTTETTRERVLEAFKESRRVGPFKRRCGYCENPDLEYENCEVPATTLEEARAWVAALIERCRDGGVL